MRLLLFIASVILLIEFRADVGGHPTIIGCYLRGLEAADVSRCNAQP